MLENRSLKILFLPLITAAAVTSIITAAYTEKGSNLINLTLRINTAGDDYAPSVTEDGTTAVFNSKMPEEKSHNIFICRNKNGLWGDPVPIFEINTDSNEETPFISADGKIIIFASDRPGGYSPPLTADGKKRITFDLYITRLTNGKWSEPEMLRGKVNTNMNERAPGLSSDGKTLYFTRWPYNNPGKSKVYSAELDGGEYINVKELPDTINTGNCEIGFRPSYSSGRYYFASRRPGGSGGWDIYYTTKSFSGFTKPVNVGSGINTPYDDMYYSESKSNSIICSDRPGGFGEFDLYSSIPAEKSYSPKKKTEIKPEKKVEHKTTMKESARESKADGQSVLNIKVIDKKSGKLIRNGSFRILVMGQREKESIVLRKTQVKSGNRGGFTLYPKDDVESVVIESSSKNYAGCSVKINVIKWETQSVTLYLDKKSSTKSGSCAEAETRPPEKISTDNSGIPTVKIIYFKFDSQEIPSDSIPEVHAVVEFMRSNPDYKVLVSGYSDSAGPAGFNDKLSMRRAQAVGNLIKSLNIAEERISVEWFGETKAVSVRKGSRYYNLDRKVELTLVK